MMALAQKTLELGIDNALGNPTYTSMTLMKEEILDNHKSVLWSFRISTKDKELRRDNNIFVMEEKQVFINI
jgi:hypothetical protein